ncbi:transposase family protein [Azospirillum lipoferum]|uniref:transposase family protein n=1 Tax=Azospirillum lipoferum TaxID=193 RepID=UPI0006626732|nr:transposase family protein [Azospirillum lipoferum]
MRRPGIDTGGHDGRDRALGEAIVFLDHFRSLPDHRQQGQAIYPLDEVLPLCLLAVLAGAESFVEIARFGTRKSAFLRRFRAFAHGTPSHDRLGDIFATLDSGHVQRCFVARVAALTGAPAEVIAIKHMAQNLRPKPAPKTCAQNLRGRAPGKDTLRVRRKLAA